jgi:hypothetical protein
MNRTPSIPTRVFGALMAPVISIGLGVMAALPSTASASAPSGCQLNSANGKIQHVIEIQFDNFHFTRDNPNVPSDLEQTPNLLNFIRSNGTLLTNHHTPLISHTANDILTTLTGVYPDQHGMNVANSYGFFRSNGSVGFNSSFAYWTDKSGDGAYNLVTPAGLNAPAPWVPFTRAGCNVGGVATANIELERLANIATVFGSPSPEATEATNDPNLANADFIGIAVHCAQGAALCAGTNGRPDVLPQEPRGYTGFNGLFGHKYLALQIGPIADLGNNVMTGFPGFGGISAAQSLGYVAALQKNGVPVTYAYIADAHDNHTTGSAMGPGEAVYRQQLQAYDQAFGTFFSRLAGDGINQSNTLFVFTSDEGDHFVGGPPTQSNCNGITIFCTYNKIGEIDGNIPALLGPGFSIHADDAPTFYVTGNPKPTDAVARNLEHAAAALVDPTNAITGEPTPLTQRLADPVEEKLLHMVTTGDPNRTPTFTMFGNPDYFLNSFNLPPAPCSGATCFAEDPGFAWNHGDFQKEIVTTWLGLVGPGVRNDGKTGEVWSDHTDVRPTILSLTGLQDDYTSQGRVLFEVLNQSAVPRSLRQHRETLQELADVYKQLNAPVGKFGLDTLRVSTRALEGNDTTYTSLESSLSALGDQRDAVAGQISQMLNAAAFGGQAINEHQANGLIDQAQTLIDRAAELAGGDDSGGDQGGGGD